MTTKEQGELADEIKAKLDEWEQRFRMWYIQKLPDMADFLIRMRERMEEFIERIEDIGNEEGPEVVEEGDPRVVEGPPHGTP